MEALPLPLPPSFWDSRLIQTGGKIPYVTQLILTKFALIAKSTWDYRHSIFHTSLSL